MAYKRFSLWNDTGKNCSLSRTAWKHCFYVVFHLFPWAHVCLPIRYWIDACVYLLIPLSLYSSRSTCYFSPLGFIRSGFSLGVSPVNLFRGLHVCFLWSVSPSLFIAWFSIWLLWTCCRCSILKASRPELSPHKVPSVKMYQPSSPLGGGKWSESGRCPVSLAFNLYAVCSFVSESTYPSTMTSYSLSAF
jgi:hypothetical protein